MDLILKLIMDTGNTLLYYVLPFIVVLGIMIFFHELGHCVLFRGHREDVNQNGSCVSIMRSGIEECWDNYRSTTREIYLDELFDELN